jgi:hypothetical protein
MAFRASPEQNLPHVAGGNFIKSISFEMVLSNQKIVDHASKPQRVFKR